MYKFLQTKPQKPQQTGKSFALSYEVNIKKVLLKIAFALQRNHVFLFRVVSIELKFLNKYLKDPDIVKLEFL